MPYTRHTPNRNIKRRSKTQEVERERGRSKCGMTDDTFRRRQENDKGSRQMESFQEKIEHLEEQQPPKRRQLEADGPEERMQHTQASPWKHRKPSWQHRQPNSERQRKPSTGRRRQPSKKHRQSTPKRHRQPKEVETKTAQVT